MKFTRTTLLCLFATLYGVSTSFTLGSDTPEAEVKAPAPRDFAYAMDRLRPLRVIEGGSDSAACAPSPTLSARFADAIDYAESMGSYSLLIWKDGSCQLEKYFPPFDRDTRPESASMHKSVVGILVAAAIADGHISGPDARVGDYLDAWAQDPRGDITVRQLLTMSSGLSGLSREGGMQSPSMRYVTDQTGIEEATLGMTLGDMPGTVFGYMGANTQLLLMILETATGMDYADYASARLWRQLDAADAYVWMYSQPSMPRAYMSLLAPARDWLKLGLLLKDYGRYGDRQIIPRELIEQATSPSRTNANYGWQMWLGSSYQAQRFYDQDKTGASVPMSEPFRVEDMIFFDGFGGQRVYISRSEDLVIVRQGDMRTDWDDARLPNLVLRANDE